MEKPIQVRPALYTMFYENLKVIALEYGYNLILHGSVHRDLDLVAVPWINNPKPELDMIKEFDRYFSGRCCSRKEDYLHSVLPGGRNAYVINLNRGDKKGEWNGFDEQYYLDISVTPLGVMPENKCDHSSAINDYVADTRWCPDCGYIDEPIIKKQK